jgi:hypothetical protein
MENCTKIRSKLIKLSLEIGNGSNNGRKFQACYDRGIALCIIDSSKQKYVKESNSIKFLDIITNIINESSGSMSRTLNV